MILSEALCIGALSFGTLAFTAATPPPSLFLINGIVANQTALSNLTTVNNLPPDPYVYTSADPIIITFHTYGPPLWSYSVEHIIVDAILAAEGHDETAIINARKLRYEDTESPSETAALEIFFRYPMTWHGWTTVVDALQKVFKGEYVHLWFDVVINERQGARYLAIGRLFDPRKVPDGTARHSRSIGNV